MDVLNIFKELQLPDILMIWLVAINMLTYAIYAIDKYKAVHHMWRIPEKTLILLAVIGGSAGALLAMYTIRHKTKHNKFRIGIPAILLAQIIIGFVVILGGKA